MNSLTGLQREWDQFAESDALFAILSDPRKRGGRWDLPSFFETGEREIATVLGYLESQGLVPDSSGSALDFGCGIGRLTQALGKRFDHALGLDISPVMIEQAERLSRSGGTSCEFRVNSIDRLDGVPDGSQAFVYSSVVLQHIEPGIAERYIRDFLRVLKPAGIAVFQTADGRAHGAPSDRAKDFVQRLGARLRLEAAALRRRVSGGGEEVRLEMNFLPEERVRDTVRAAGGEVRDVRHTNSTEPDFNGNLRFLAAPPRTGIASKQYCVTRAG